MTARLIGKQQDWQLDRDDEGHRTYKITWLVMTDDFLDGPKVVLDCPQLPVSGSAWAFDNDFDDWAWCRAQMSVRRYAPQKGARHKFWTVEQTFSTKPPSKPRCQDVPVEDPLLEPAKISGGGVKYTEEAAFDRFGQPLLNSAHEAFHGAPVEFDANRNTVKIEQNVGSWTDVVNAMNATDTVNSLELWGAPPRCVKLSNVSWERQFWQKCVIYFKRTLTFDIFIKQDPETGAALSGFDKDLLDVGTKVLRGQLDQAGKWVLRPFEGYDGTPNPDPQNPKHFILYRDSSNAASQLLLNGAGLPAGVAVVTGNRFISILNTNTGNQPGEDDAAWLPLVGSLPVPQWSATDTYTTGNVVSLTAFGQTDYFYAKAEPAVGDSPVLNPDWLWLNPTGAMAAPSNKGTWAVGTSYALGDVVTGTEKTDPGKFHIEHYEETDFTTLNIPVDFTVP